MLMANIILISDLFDDLFYHSSCLTFLSVAYIRRKVCECRGRASVLVTTRYAVKTFLICLIPVFLFNAATLSLMSTTRPLDKNVSITKDVPLLLDESNLAFEICRIMILNMFPLLISSILYARIFQILLQTSKTMEGTTTGQRTRNPTKLITQSVIILLSVTCSVWIVFLITKTASLFVSFDEKFFIYWKIFFVIAHPFGEGLLHPSARKPVRRVQEWMHERSVRRVGPSLSPTMTYDQDSIMYSDTGRSLAEQLPTLLEERDSMIPCHSVSASDDPVKASCSGQPTPIRRPSIRYMRPSMLVRNAGYIGLECRDTSSVINIYRGRKQSVEKLKRELKNVEERTTERTAARRLSTCLRLSTVDDFSEDEVYERYREMYNRRGSKYSDKSSSRKRSVNSGLMPEYKGLSYANNSCYKERKETDGSSVYNSPSRRRWKKLYTTARTARQFTKFRGHHSARIEEEVGKHSVYSNGEREMHNPAPNFDQARKTKASKDEDRDREVRISVSSLAPQHLCGQFGAHRRSLDSYLRSQDSELPKQNPVIKKRSISCVNNVWLKAREEHARKKGPRKASVAVISSGNDTSNSHMYINNNAARSLSYDTKEYYNYKKHQLEHDQSARRSYGNNRYSRHSQEKIKVAHWLLEKDTTKEECIEKLIEMKDYF